MAEAEVGVGTVLGGTYEISGLLGRGGMGAVWTASHLRLPGKRVAVKVLHAANLNDESYARFRREAEIASRIGHPNIVEVLDWNTLPDGQTPYMVLEYLSGETLAGRLARGSLPLDQTLGIVRQIGSALHAAHRAGVVHRDLKPDNIFLCPTDSGGHVTEHIKILDFGISKIRDSTTLQTQDAKLLGTPQYMAPEQAMGKNAEVDERADLFALGSIVYEMLSGRAAFGGDNIAAIAFNVVYSEPEPLQKVVPGLPKSVVAAVQKALAKAPGDRQPNVLAFVSELTGKPMTTLDRDHTGPVMSRAAYAETADAASYRPGVLAAGTPGPGLATARVRRRPRVWVWLVVVLGMLGVGAAVAVISQKQQAASGAAPDAARAAAMAPDAARAVAAAPDATPIAVARAADAAPVAASKPDAAPPAVTKVHRRPQPEPQPQPQPREDEEEPGPGALTAELVDAQRALAAGEYGTAIRLARRSLQDRKTPFAYSIIAIGYCGLRDLGNAKAAMQNVAGRARVRVVRRCRQLGFPLD